MSNVLKAYRGYRAYVEFDSEDMVLRGKVLDISDQIVFYILKPEKAQKEFEQAIDNYLESCADADVPPKKPAEELDASEELKILVDQVIEKAKQEGFSLLVTYFNTLIMHFEMDGYAIHKTIWDEVPLRLQSSSMLRESLSD